MGKVNFGRGEFSPFLVMCPRRSVGNQRLAQTENGSDLLKNAPPFFCTKNMKPKASLLAAAAVLHNLQIASYGNAVFHFPPIPDEKEKNTKIIHFFILTDIIWQSVPVYYRQNQEQNAEVKDEDQEKQPNLVWNHFGIGKPDRGGKDGSRKEEFDNSSYKRHAGDNRAGVNT